MLLLADIPYTDFAYGPPDVKFEIYESIMGGYENLMHRDTPNIMDVAIASLVVAGFSIEDADEFIAHGDCGAFLNDIRNSLRYANLCYAENGIVHNPCITSIFESRWA